MMRARTWLLAALASSIAACAVEPRDAGLISGEPAASPAAGGTQAALVIEPTLELVGLAGVYDRLVVTALEFDAEVYLIRADETAGLDGDVVNVHYLFRDGYASTARPDGDLTLQGPGRYRVLVRVHANAPTGEWCALNSADRPFMSVRRSVGGVDVRLRIEPAVGVGRAQEFHVARGDGGTVGVREQADAGHGDLLEA